jgi:hypothetical protein
VSFRLSQEDQALKNLVQEHGDKNWVLLTTVWTTTRLRDSVRVRNPILPHSPPMTAAYNKQNTCAHLLAHAKRADMCAYIRARLRADMQYSVRNMQAYTLVNTGLGLYTRQQAAGRIACIHAPVMHARMHSQ